MLTVALVAAGAVVGYWTGRLGLGGQVDRWAHAAGHRGRRSPLWWLAQAVFALEVAYAWTVHPRRTRANVKAYRAWLNAPRSPAVKVRDLTGGGA